MKKIWNYLKENWFRIFLILAAILFAVGLCDSTHVINDYVKTVENGKSLWEFVGFTIDYVGLIAMLILAGIYGLSRAVELINNSLGNVLEVCLSLIANQYKLDKRLTAIEKKYGIKVEDEDVEPEVVEADSDEEKAE